MKKTYAELLEIDALIGKLYANNPELKETKFGYAYNKFYKQNLEKAIEQYKEDIRELGINEALEDPVTRAIVRDEKSVTGFAHTKEQLLNYYREYKKLSDKFDNTEIEVQPYISTYIPDLPTYQIELLTGLVI